jgi:hypothetical protein
MNPVALATNSLQNEKRTLCHSLTKEGTALFEYIRTVQNDGRVVVIGEEIFVYGQFIRLILLRVAPESHSSV